MDRNADLQTRFPRRATVWKLKSTSLEFDSVPAVMGIVNVTPDSFSDGGQFFDPAEAIDHGLRLAAEGADILDVGGESTRPYSEPVKLEEELRRVERVVAALAEQTDVPISIDTSKAKVAAAALDAGAEIINDVTGLEGDPQMLAVAVERQAGVCAMHMQGNPQNMQDDPRYDDVVEDIHTYLGRRIDALIGAGVDKERICIDPGIGFGKTHQHNLTLAARCGRFHDHGHPLLVGHSRKGFIGKLIGDREADRTAATLGASLALVRQGVQILRVHDVLATQHAMTVFEACGGVNGNERAID